MTSTMSWIDDITMTELERNPYPVYERLRAEAPLAYPGSRVVCRDDRGHLPVDRHQPRLRGGDHQRGRSYLRTPGSDRGERCDPRRPTVDGRSCPATPRGRPVDRRPRPADRPPVPERLRGRGARRTRRPVLRTRQRARSRRPSRPPVGEFGQVARMVPQTVGVVHQRGSRRERRVHQPGRLR